MNKSKSSTGTKSPGFTAANATPLAKKKEKDYCNLSPQQLQDDQNALTKDVSELLDIPEDHASVLLLEFKWDREKLLDAFYSEPEKTRIRAGAIQGELNKLSPELLNSKFFCSVIYEEVPYSETLSMGCEKKGEKEHRFSLDAWEMFLVCKVGEGAVCLFARCQAKDCNCVISPRVWRVVLKRPKKEPVQKETNDAALAKYERFLSSNYVDMNRSIRWCPSPQCGYAVRALGPCRE